MLQGLANTGRGIHALLEKQLLEKMNGAGEVLIGIGAHRLSPLEQGRSLVAPLLPVQENKRATTAMYSAESLELSVVSYMELLHVVGDRKDLRLTKAFLADLDFQIVPLSESIGHRAAIYLEEYGSKSHLGVPDALIAATAVVNDTVLCSVNAKDYRDIAEVKLKVFRP